MGGAKYLCGHCSSSGASQLNSRLHEVESANRINGLQAFTLVPISVERLSEMFLVAFSQRYQETRACFSLSSGRNGHDFQKAFRLVQRKRTVTARTGTTRESP